MAMDRDEILKRLVTGAEYIEREDITRLQRTKAKARYDELEADFHRLNEQEKAYKPPVPEAVQSQMDLIRGMLKPEKERKRA